MYCLKRQEIEQLERDFDLGNVLSGNHQGNQQRGHQQESQQRGYQQGSQQGSQSRTIIPYSQRVIIPTSSDSKP